MVVFTMCGKKLRKKNVSGAGVRVHYERVFERDHDISWLHLSSQFYRKKKYRKLTFLHKHPQHFHHKPAPVERLAVCVHF